MRLQQLAYFVAVADLRHFTRAAELVRVAQPSLSKQIRNLERELGAPVFSRARGNVSLTPAGDTLLPYARRILADVEGAAREVQELLGLQRGRVRIGATPSVCTVLLPEALRRFRDLYPGIELVVQEGGSRDLVRELGSGGLDLGLVILPLASHDAALTTAPILRERLVVAAPADGPLRGRREVRVSELRDVPLVMFREGYDLRASTLQAFRRARIEPRFAVEGGEMDAVLEFVEAGLGVAVVPSMVLAGRPRLRGIPFAPPGLYRTVAVAHRRDIDPPHAARAFRSTFAELLAEMRSARRLSPGVEVLDGSRGRRRSRRGG